MATLLHSVRDVVSTLGGVGAVAARFDCTEQAVFRWLKAGMLPAKLYLAIKADLAATEHDAPNELFSMVPAASHNPHRGVAA